MTVSVLDDSASSQQVKIQTLTTGRYKLANGISEIWPQLWELITSAVCCINFLSAFKEKYFENKVKELPLQTTFPKFWILTEAKYRVLVFLIFLLLLDDKN